MLEDAHGEVDGFESGFSLWYDVCQNSRLGLAKALDDSFENRRNMLDRIQFLTPDLEQQVKALEGLKAELAKLKGTK